MPAWVEDPFASSVSATATPFAATYTPGETWDGSRGTPLRIPLGTDIPLEFSPAGGDTVIVASEYEVRVRIPGSDPLETYSVALGNLSANETTGKLTVNWTAAETAEFPANASPCADVIRTAPTGGRTHEGRAYLLMTSPLA